MHLIRRAAGFAASLVLIGLAAAPALAQEPMRSALIVPLSPPGDATARPADPPRRRDRRRYDQRQGRRAAAARSKLSVQDSQGKPEAGVAAYRRLVERGQGRRGARLLPQLGDHRRQRGRQGDGRADHRRCRPRRGRHHRQALRHRLPHPCGRSGARLDLDGVHQEEGLQARLA